VKQKTDELLDLNNQLARLKKQLEHHQQEASLQVGVGVACGRGCAPGSSAAVCSSVGLLSTRPRTCRTC
jgi:transposase